jgi:hypothetical protein
VVGSGGFLARANNVMCFKEPPKIMAIFLLAEYQKVYFTS